MADKKITQLTAVTQANSFDLFPIVDLLASETKKIRVDDLFASPTAIGSSNPSTGSFTTLSLPTGSTINEFSTDTTLGGNSDLAVPTEKAIKTYVDSSISSITNKIYQGDSSVVVIDTTAALASITFTVDGNIEALIDSTGLTLATGVYANEISNDKTLSDESQSSLVTEYAIKSYVDVQIENVKNEVNMTNTRNINSDTTAVIGDICLVDTNSGPVTITLVETEAGRLIIKKISTDSNQVYVTTNSSNIDNEEIIPIDTPYKSTTFFGTGSSFYII